MWIQMTNYEMIVNIGGNDPVCVIYDPELREIVVRANYTYHAWRITRNASETLYEFDGDCPVKAVAIRFETGLWVRINP